MIENMFSHIPDSLSEELFDTILETNYVRIERIVSKGHCSPKDFWYDQDELEWVLLIKGAARIQFTDHFVELRTGDYIPIAPHQKHRVDWTSDEETIWLALFLKSPP